MKKKKILIIGRGFMGGSMGLALTNTGQYSIGYYDIKQELNTVSSSVHSQYIGIDDLEACDLEYDVILNCTGKDEVSYLFTKPIISITSVQDETIDTWDSDNNFIYCHPMCGSEKSGNENANENLFKNQTCIITTEGKEQSIIALATDIFTAIGMRVQFCETKAEHNQNVAKTSHLLHYLAFDKRFENLHPVLIRLSRSNKEIWNKIFAENKKHIESAKMDLLYILFSKNLPFVESYKILIQNIPQYFYGTALKELINFGNNIFN